MDFFFPSKFQAILALATTFILCYYAWIAFGRKTRNTADANDSSVVPEPAGAWPILGHLPLLTTPEPLFRTLGSMADKYGPIFMVRFGLQPTLVVSSLEMAKECLLTNDRALASRPTSASGEYMTYNYAMFGFSPYGPYWRAVRKIATLELLSKHRLESFKHVPYSEIDMCIKSLYQQTSKSDDHTVEMNQWFGELLMNIVLRMVVGKRCFNFDDTKQESAEMRKLHRTIKDFFKLAGVSVASDALPFLSWLDLDGQKRAMKKTAKAMDLITQNWLNEHRKNRLINSTNQGKVEQDFMDVLLSTVENGKTQLQHYDPDTVIKATSLAIILAGTDTTSLTLSWILSLLLNHSSILRKAQEELDVKVGRSRLVEESDIENLPYLQAIIKEALRLYPAGPLSVPHEATQDCQVGEFKVRKGTRVLVNIWKLHRDPNLWSNPSLFQPERFIEGKANVDFRGQNFEYIPFGSGRRMCPGLTFAFQTMSMALARLLQAFELRTPSNEPVDMTEGSGLTMPKTTPLPVIFKPRLSSQLYK